MGDVKGDNKPVMHRVVIRKADVRELYLLVQRATPGNRTGERWLSAADAELYDRSFVTVKPGGAYHLEAIDEPDATVEFEMSDAAAKGIKLAAVQALLGNAVEQRPPANLGARKVILDACKGFGKKFVELVQKEGRLPESSDLNEEDPLELAEEEAKKA